MKKNTTTILLVAGAAAAGYYFYTKSKAKKEAASKVSIEPDEKEKEGEEGEDKQQAPQQAIQSMYSSGPAYAVPSGSAAPMAKLTRAEDQIKKVTQAFKIIKRKKSRRKLGKKLLRSAARSIFSRYMPQKQVGGFDNCIGLF